MMYETRSLMSWSVRLALPPLAGMLTLPGSPDWLMRPLVMMLMRNAGSRACAFDVTPGSRVIGLRAGPIPPPRLAPWQVAQLVAKRVAPLAGSPGNAGPDGDGVLSARVLTAVSATRIG